MNLQTFRVLVEIVVGARALWDAYEYLEERRRRKREAEAPAPSQIVEFHHLTPRP